MTWSTKAPKTEGYYWFLPARSRKDSGNKPRGKFDLPTVMHRDKDGDWSFVGNDQTKKASNIRGRWWTEELLPPPFK